MTASPPPPPDPRAQTPFRELSRTFWRGLASSQGLGPAMARVLTAFNEHCGTRRASVWLHVRRARTLVLAASSDAEYTATPHQIDTAHPEEFAARGLRLERPQVLDSHSEPVLVAPLRGWRRALGTLVVEGAIGDDLSDREPLDLAADLARQLSSGIENVQIREDMLRQRRLLEDTFNSLVDLVAVIDREQRVVQMNDALAMRLGRPRPELIDRPLADLVGPELAGWAAAGGELAADPSRAHEHAGLGGTFAVTLTPLIDEDGEPVGRVLVARDVTEHARLEREREALRTKLAQSEKLASLGQFVAGIAHEINNPLQGVLGHLELLIAPPRRGSAAPDPHALRRELRRIYREADRAAKIVRNLLMFSGSQRQVRRRLHVDRVVGRALASRRRALSAAHIDVVRDHQDGHSAIVGDPLLLQQAFLNVLVNAEHAIAATGRPGSIVLTTARASGRVVTTIRDSGTGIAEDVLPRIFDPFFTTKGVGEGTGLGLAITYGIVVEHGGAIHAANNAGGGATVTIELPEALPRS